MDTRGPGEPIFGRIAVDVTGPASPQSVSDGARRIRQRGCPRTDKPPLADRWRRSYRRPVHAPNSQAFYVFPGSWERVSSVSSHRRRSARLSIHLLSAIGRDRRHHTRRSLPAGIVAARPYI